MLKIGRRLAILGLMAMTMAMAGCDDDDDGGTPPTNIAGTYTLRTVNGNAPPATVFEMTGYKLELMSATATINANGTWSDVWTTRETIGGSVEAPESLSSNGTWTRSGNTISFNDSDPEGEDFTATVQGDGAIVVSESFGGATYNLRFTK